MKTANGVKRVLVKRIKNWRSLAEFADKEYERRRAAPETMPNGRVYDLSYHYQANGLRCCADELENIVKRIK